MGAEIVKSVKPGQMVVKIVHDALVETLGGSEGAGLNLRAAPPVPILMVGLQGSGKTTTTAKIAKRLTERDKRKVLMASLDTRRPAAQEQLAILGQQVKVDTLAIVTGETPVADRQARHVGGPQGRLRRGHARHRGPPRTSTRNCWPKPRRCATSPSPTRRCWSPTR